ncbi:MAG: hypothetical protein ACI909_004235 [Planctomycetota bacterium]|jgi:hypothetical protein
MFVMTGICRVTGLNLANLRGVDGEHILHNELYLHCKYLIYIYLLLINSLVLKRRFH